MHRVRAILCLGLFGYFGYAVWTDQFAGGSSSKARAVGDVIGMVTERFGVEGTSIMLVSLGVILAFYCMILQAREERERLDYDA